MTVKELVKEFYMSKEGGYYIVSERKCINIMIIKAKQVISPSEDFDNR